MKEHSGSIRNANLSAFSIDRELPVALGAQLRGLIEFGIGLGTLRPGERLPSVRELAEHLGVAPMTVAQVYLELRRAGMVVSRTGAGTFVAPIAPAAFQPVRDVSLHRAIDGLIAQGRALGLRPSDLVGLIAARAGTCDRGGFADRPGKERPRVVLVGHFAATTAAYGVAMADIVDDAVSIEPMTIRAIRDDEKARVRAEAADLVVTFAHRRADVMALLPRQRVAAVTFIPSSATRQAMAALDPGARVVAVSVYPEFASVMKAEVQRFAPHVSALSVVMHDAPGLAETVRRADIVVFATGADDLGLALPEGMPSFEFRYTPDPSDTRRLLLPMLDDGRPTLALESAS